MYGFDIVAEIWTHHRIFEVLSAQLLKCGQKVVTCTFIFTHY